jgi:hypothetical protein
MLKIMDVKMYKVYALPSKTEETYSIIKSYSLKSAYLLAAQIKQLPLDEFKKIFGVKLL